MILKVKPEELYDVTKVIKEDKEKTDIEIEKMEKSLEKLQRVWQGQDSAAFCTNLSNFILKMKGIPATFDTISKICDETNEGYTSRDKAFAKELEQVAMNHE